MILSLKKKIFNSKIYNYCIENAGATHGKDPSVFLSGVEKCGTSTLYDAMTKHPKIQQGTTKEVFYFNKNFNRSLNWYRGHWLASRGLAVDGCPTYYRHKETLQLIKKIYPDGKHIVILRDPIKRFESALNMCLVNGWDDRDFDQIIADEYLNGSIDDGYLAQGRYDEIIERYESVFDLDQLHVLFFEDLISNPKKELNLIFEFLNLDCYNIDKLPHLNKGKYLTRFGIEQIDFLKMYFQPNNIRLEQILDRALPYKI